MCIFFCVTLSLFYFSPSLHLCSLFFASPSVSRSLSLALSLALALCLCLWLPWSVGGRRRGAAGGGEQRSDCAKEGLQKGRVPQICTGGRALVSPAAIGECGADACKVGWSRVSGHAVRRSAPLSTPRQPPRPRTANPGIATNPRRPPLVLSLWPEPPPRG
jgi:hypothetical protein